MAFALGLPKYARALLVPVGLFLTAVLNAVVRSSVEATAKEGNVNFSVWGPVSVASAWLAGHWVMLLGWVLALTLVAMIALAYRDERREQPLRVLLTFYHRIRSLRNTMVRPEIDHDRIFELTRSFSQIQSELIDTASRMFPPSIVDKFRIPQFVDVDAVTDVDDAITFVHERRLMIAAMDHLANELHVQWSIRQP